MDLRKKYSSSSIVLEDVGVITRSLIFLDLIRIKILQISMKYSIFKKIFEYRPYRLFAFFMFSFSFNIILAFNAPLWALLFGPLILGVPHLISSVRYLPRFVATDFSELEKTKLFYNLIGLSFFGSWAAIFFR